MALELRSSARDIIFVHECRWVLHSREHCRPCLVCNGVVISHTQRELENTCTFVLNRLPMIEMNVSQVYAFQFCLDEIQWHSSATFVRSSSLVRTVSMILSVS